MKKFFFVNLLFIILIFIFSCGNTKYDDMKIKMKKAGHADVMFFNNENHIIGIDPGDYKKKIDYEFNYFVSYGDMSEDHRLFIGDNGTGAGSRGKHIVVINKRGRIVNKFETLPNPFTMKIVGKRLFVDSAAFYDDNYTAISVFDTETYELVHRASEVVNWITNRNSWRYEDSALVGIVPLNSMKRKGYIQKFHLESLSNKKLFNFTERFPDEIFSLLIDQDNILIIYKNSLIIDIFNLKTNQLIKSIDVKNNIPGIKDVNPQALSFYDARIDGKKILVVLKDKMQDYYLQKIIVLDRSEYKITSEIDLDKSYDISTSTLHYLKERKLFFKSMDTVAVFDSGSGKLLSEINLSK